jgi:hypothetical protein
MSSYTDNDPRGFCGDPKRGAALGRPSIHFTFSDGTPEFESLSVIRKQLDDGGYDENGTYFGIGDPLFWVSSEGGEVDYMIRAHNLNDARAQVRGRYPSVAIAGDVYDISLDFDTLQGLLEHETEGHNSAYINDEIKVAANEFETAVWRTLETWVSANLGLLKLDGIEPGEDGLFTGSVVREMSSLRGGAGYLYYMEHEGAGVGTWDGDWDHLFKDHRVTLRVLSEVVKKETYAEYQKLHDALMNCALESVPEDEDE